MISGNRCLLKKILLFLLKLLAVSVDFYQTPRFVENTSDGMIFIVEMEHLFIRNIYSDKDLEKMENLKYICNYNACFEKFIELIPKVEDAIENPQWIREKDKFEDFMRYDLNDVYSHLSEMKEAIDELKIVKKIDKFAYIGKKIFLFILPLWIFVKLIR